MNINPNIKLLLRMKKPWLIEKAKAINIDPTGKNKTKLAEEIAIHEEKEHTRIWNAIANGRKS